MASPRSGAGKTRSRRPPDLTLPANAREAACRLYLISPPAVDDPAHFRRSLAAALAGGDVGAFQLRLKGVPAASVARVVGSIRPLLADRAVPLILNDDPALARELGCDGVHIGQEDAPYREARRIVGPEGIVGVTCHASRHLAMEAAEAGADYVAFGAFFPTATKTAKTRADPEILEVWSETMLVPCVAIGGITPENCRMLVTAGADFVASSAGVWSHPQGPEAAVRAFDEAIADALATCEARPG